MSLQRCVWVKIIKLKKVWFLHTELPVLSITQDLYKIKNPKDRFVDIGVSRKRVQNFNKKRLNPMVVGAGQIF